MKTRFLLAGAAAGLALIPAAQAHEGDGGTVTYATDHAPIGVMADHRHEKGEWMVSYRYMYMDMAGSRDGTDSLSPEEVITYPNRFANPPMMPPNLRVVPDTMTMQMHMVGGMYGLTDRITLMAMGMYVTKEMDHITFQGPMGTTRLGEFTVETSGIGDTSIGAIFGLDDGAKAHNQTNFALMVSLPTGSVDETAEVLTPMNMRPTLRTPYAMQLGSGTVDLKPSLTTRKRLGDWSLGGQVSGVIRLDENDEGYALGDVFGATAWAAYEVNPSFSLSGRVKAQSTGSIDGIDPAIMAPVQTANPDNYGGETVEVLIGANLVGQTGALAGHRLGIEIGLPVYRDLNGPQMETDLTLTLGWQKAF
ncbi:MAG: transporter [Hyphomonadaceae bacterium]|nr:transporter [Hyphomonadaceae bacterium]